MKRRSRSRSTGGLLLVLSVLALAWGEPGAEQWAVSRLRAEAARRGMGGWQVRTVHWRWPGHLLLEDVRLSGPDRLKVVAPRVTIEPDWWSWAAGGERIRYVRVDRPSIELRLGDGASRWGAVVPAGRPGSATFSGPGSAVSGVTWPLHVDTLVIADARVNLLDDGRTPPFAMTFERFFATLGPWGRDGSAGAGDGAPISAALRAQLPQGSEEPAVLECAGWLATNLRDLQGTCRVDRMPVALFEPYYQGMVQLRAYDARLRGVGHASAADNQLEVVLRLEIDRLSEVDLSYLGRTIMDIKRLAPEADRVLTGEIRASGPLDRPSVWRVRLVPGNVIVQRLLEMVLEHGIRALPVQVGGETVQVGLTSAPDVPSDGRHMDVTAPTIVGLPMDLPGGPAPSPAVSTDPAEASTSDAIAVPSSPQ
jgi:hypothetical protein